MTTTPAGIACITAETTRRTVTVRDAADGLSTDIQRLTTTGT